MQRSAREALSQFGSPWNAKDVRIELLPTGWSGGQVFRVVTPWREAALRQWPQAMPSQRANLVHLAQSTAFNRGLLVVPELIRTPEGASLIQEGGFNWDLSDWRRGEPAPASSPHPEHGRQAARLWHRWYEVGRDHHVLHAFGEILPSELFHAISHRYPSPSSGIARRLHLYRQRTPIREVEFLSISEQLLSERTTRLLNKAENWFVELARYERHPLQIELCLRDVHREHILFENERVSGLIDFGSIGWDTPAIDISRYLSSFDAFPSDWLAREDDCWQAMVDPTLSVKEWNRLILLLAVTGAMVSAIQWENWLVRERRRFISRDKAYQRWSNRLDFAEPWIYPDQT